MSELDLCHFKGCKCGTSLCLLLYHLCDMRYVEVELESGVTRRAIEWVRDGLSFKIWSEDDIIVQTDFTGWGGREYLEYVRADSEPPVVSVSNITRDSCMNPNFMRVLREMAMRTSGMFNFDRVSHRCPLNVNRDLWNLLYMRSWVTAGDIYIYCSRSRHVEYLVTRGPLTLEKLRSSWKVVTDD